MTRTDNDTWDLATSVGATATMVAAARAIATKADEPLIDDPFAEPLVRAVGVDFLTRWATGELSGDDLDADGSGWGLQQMPAAMASRTMFFDGFFADAAAAGIRQAVIFASGLDARAYRFDWPSDMTVFEIDQPEVIAFKTATLSGLGAEPTAQRAHRQNRNRKRAIVAVAALDGADQRARFERASGVGQPSFAARNDALMANSDLDFPTLLAECQPVGPKATAAKPKPAPKDSASA